MLVSISSEIQEIGNSLLTEQDDWSISHCSSDEIVKHYFTVFRNDKKNLRVLNWHDPFSGNIEVTIDDSKELTADENDYLAAACRTRFFQEDDIRSL